MPSPSPQRGPNPAQTSPAVAAAEARLGLKLPFGPLESVIDELGLLAEERGLSPEALAAAILGAERDSALMHRLARAASVGETYLFRMPEQLESLARRVREVLVPLKRAERRTTIRAWSAACATGEEAYTLALLLRDAAPGFTISVVGTDMNPDAIRAAREGRFRARALAGSAGRPGLRRTAQGWEVEDDVRASVSFETWNLVTDPLPAPEINLSGFDVVLVRNVLIYLDPQRIPAVMGRIAACCAPQALLALTPAEYRAAAHVPGFEAVGQAILERGTSSAARSAPAAKPALVSVPLGPIAGKASPVAATSRAGVATTPAGVGATRASAGTTAHGVAGTSLHVAGTTPHVVATTSPHVAGTRPSLAEHASTPSAIATPPRADGAAALLARARQEADRTAFDRAEALARQAERLEPESAGPPHLLGMVAAARGDHAAAATAFRRALFLDGAHLGAALGLGRALAALGRREARDVLGRAVRALKAVPPDREIPDLELDASSALRLAEDGLRRLPEGT